MTQRDNDMRPDRDRIRVVELLCRKLPEAMVASANPIPPKEEDVARALEPWLTIVEPQRKIEVHVREGGDVEFHVYVSGRAHDPKESLFVCDGDYEEFTTYLAENFDRLTERLS